MLCLKLQLEHIPCLVMPLEEGMMESELVYRSLLCVNEWARERRRGRGGIVWNGLRQGCDIAIIERWEDNSSRWLSNEVWGSSVSMDERR